MTDVYDLVIMLQLLQQSERVFKGDIKDICYCCPNIAAALLTICYRSITLEKHRGDSISSIIDEKKASKLSSRIYRMKISSVNRGPQLQGNRITIIGKDAHSGKGMGARAE